jgi:hypothetical protein
MGFYVSPASSKKEWLAAGKQREKQDAILMDKIYTDKGHTSLGLPSSGSNTRSRCMSLFQKK